MNPIVRFAPSPTGQLHIGGVRTALFNYAFAKKFKGSFLLRIEDTDKERSKDEYTEQILESLAWLGFDYDEEPLKQSARSDRYKEVINHLLDTGNAYRCFASNEELEKIRQKSGSYLYPRIWRDRSKKEVDSKILNKVEHTIRMRIPVDGEISFEDLVYGKINTKCSELDDFIIARSDGSPTYNLTVVVDDYDMNISHVIRGEDHVTNTAAQVELIAALGGEVPEFAHFSLMLGADGSGLSKRLGSLALADLRDSGLEPISLNAHIARLGTADPVVPAHTMQEIIDGFDMARLGRAPARFDPEDVTRLNARILHETPYAVVAERLVEIGAPAQVEFWEAMRGNIEKFADMQDIMALIKGPITPVVETDDAEYIAQARTLLPDAPLDTESWSDWTGRLKDETGRNGRALFMPLRMALTGQSHGPEMQHLLYHIGYDEVVARLEAAGKH